MDLKTVWSVKPTPTPCKCRAPCDHICGMSLKLALAPAQALPRSCLNWCLFTGLSHCWPARFHSLQLLECKPPYGLQDTTPAPHTMHKDFLHPRPAHLSRIFSVAPYLPVFVHLYLNLCDSMHPVPFAPNVLLLTSFQKTVHYSKPSSAISL